jgi:hypothetical protein
MRRYKSLFRYWTLKQLENAKQYKKSSKQYSFDTSNVTKTLKFPKRLLRMSEIIMECDEQEGLQTPPAFNEFEVLGRAQQKDIEDEVVSQGSNKVKVSIEFANFIGHLNKNASIVVLSCLNFFFCTYLLFMNILKPMNPRGL